ncbi:hypothetical protein BH10CYA1_BH10CYA1_53310 [soil metagenome]
MLVCFRFASSLTHRVSLPEAPKPQFDFTTPVRPTQTRKKSGFEAQEKKCWDLYRQGEQHQAEFEITKLLSKRLSGRTKVKCLHLLALILMDQNNFKDAEKKLWQALDIQSKNVPTAAINELDIRLSLARLFHLTDATSLYERQMLRVIVVSDNIMDSLPPGFQTDVLAPTLMNLGEAYLLQMRISEAHECFKRVVDLLDKNGGSELVAASARLHLDAYDR